MQQTAYKKWIFSFLGKQYFLANIIIQTFFFMVELTIVSDKSDEKRYILPYLEKGLNVTIMNCRLKKGLSITTSYRKFYIDDADFRHRSNLIKEYT
ncbi:MAG: hypothetical protein ACJARM_002509 [Glaciecola sp.]|jgi:hypothetical protein